MTLVTTQTNTPVNLLGRPPKQALVDEFVNKSIINLRTPALIIDRHSFAKNCERMHNVAHQWGARFRAHLKSHKTAEGTRLQLITAAGQTDAVVVSTVMEAWEVYNSGLVAEGIVKDILYGMPIAVNKLTDLASLADALSEHGAILRIHIDHLEQIEALEHFHSLRTGRAGKWSAFVKIDCGDKRAGVPAASSELETLLTRLIASPAVMLYGFYCHQGGSYASTSQSDATGFLTRELEAINTAAGLALALLAGSTVAHEYVDPFILSIGSTPTMHAASAATRSQLERQLNGKMELHAGNYPLLDLQQLNTGMVEPEQISQRVIATVVSYYPGRGPNGEDEAMCDAGAIAMSKDKGPLEGYGEVIGKKWRLSRISQEHGILVKTENALFAKPDQDGESLKIGDQVQIVGQHACLITAAYPWYYIVDSSTGSTDTVVDVWVPWKGW